MDTDYCFRSVLFFTRGMSLRAWDESGLLSREVAIYRKFQEQGVQVTFVTYGDAGDLLYAEQLPGITICCNRWGLPQRLYERLLPWLHRDVLRGADLIKTNQTDGADVALRCARRWRKPLLARCGYMWSDFSARQHGTSSALAARSARVEGQVFGASSRIVVTTEDMREDVAARFPHLAEKTVVVPNYVDAELFAPAGGEAPGGSRLCYVGRLNQEQKNLRALMAAVRDLDVDLDIIGDGPLRGEAEAESKCNPRLHLLGRVPNHRLPGLLTRSAIYVLPSVYEGHPKTLLEAMACALPVIASNVPGIASVIRHGETGWLCDPTPESIRQAIRTVLADAALREKLGRGARQFVVRNYSLPRVTEKELALYREVVGSLRGAGA